MSQEARLGTAKPFPTPSKIRMFRTFHGLTPEQAAETIYRTEEQWLRYESGKVGMPIELWELFRLKIQHGM